MPSRRVEAQQVRLRQFGMAVPIAPAVPIQPTNPTCRNSRRRSPISPPMSFPFTSDRSRSLLMCASDLATASPSSQDRRLRPSNKALEWMKDEVLHGVHLPNQCEVWFTKFTIKIQIVTLLLTRERDGVVIGSVRLTQHGYVVCCLLVTGRLEHAGAH